MSDQNKKISLHCTSQRTGYSVFFEGRTSLGDGLNMCCRQSSSLEMERGLQEEDPSQRGQQQRHLAERRSTRAVLPVEERSKNDEGTTTLAHCG